jgi:hypothetical protein
MARSPCGSKAAVEFFATAAFAFAGCSHRVGDGEIDDPAANLRMLSAILPQQVVPFR